MAKLKAFGAGVRSTMKVGDVCDLHLLAVSAKKAPLYASRVYVIDRAVVGSDGRFEIHVSEHSDYSNNLATRVGFITRKANSNHQFELLISPEAVAQLRGVAFGLFEKEYMYEFLIKAMSDDQWVDSIDPAGIRHFLIRVPRGGALPKETPQSGFVGTYGFEKPNLYPPRGMFDLPPDAGYTQSRLMELYAVIHPAEDGRPLVRVFRKTATNLPYQQYALGAHAVTLPMDNGWLSKVCVYTIFSAPNMTAIPPMYYQSIREALNDYTSEAVTALASHSEFEFTFNW